MTSSFYEVQALTSSQPSYAGLCASRSLRTPTLDKFQFAVRQKLESLFCSKKSAYRSLLTFSSFAHSTPAEFRFPPPRTRSQAQTTILYSKETDFLEGDKSHPHTLKAGRHDFPFTYELDSRDAASIAANFGMATIEYRLRAIAVRPSFSTNFVTDKTFSVVRSFSNEVCHQSPFTRPSDRIICVPEQMLTYVFL